MANLEVRVEAVRPEDYRGTGMRDRLTRIGLDFQVFAAIRKLCHEMGFLRDLDDVFQPGLRGECRMLARTLEAGLARVDSGTPGYPYDALRVPEARGKVVELIQLASKGLGVKFTRSRKM